MGGDPVADREEKNRMREFRPLGNFVVAFFISVFYYATWRLLIWKIA
jgi:hypothetical protein